VELPSEMLMHPSHTARPVDARWQRVCDLARRAKRARHKWDDDWVRLGLRYLNRLSACSSDADRARLARQMPDLDAAYHLHATAGRLERGVVEGRLLAGQTVEQVAAACGLSTAAVTAYEKLFFQVLGRLDAREFIYIHAVGPKMWTGFEEDDVDLLLKVRGFQRGPLTLELLLNYLRHGLQVPDRLEGAGRERLEELVMMLTTKACVQSRTLPFPRCVRALRLVALSDELAAYVASLPARESAGKEARSGEAAKVCWEGVCSPPVAAPEPAEGVPPLGEDRGAWWSAWRAAVLAA